MASPLLCANLSAQAEPRPVCASSELARASIARLREVGDACRALADSVESPRQKAEALYLLGVARSSESRVSFSSSPMLSEEARAALSQAVQLNPAHPAAWFELGQAARSLSKYREAIRAYQHHRQLHQGDTAVVAFTLPFEGLAYWALSDFTAAESAHREALLLRPRDSFNWENLGLALMSQGRLAEACDAWRRAVVIDPQNQSAAVVLRLAESSGRCRP